MFSPTNAIPSVQRILGIDPGLRITGFGCVDLARAQSGSCTLVEAGVIRLVRRGQPTGSIDARLLQLDREFAALLDGLAPQCVAIEGLFAHRAHPATAMVMGHARGVLLRAVRARGLRLVELKPALVKKHLTGNGRADKAQMQRAVQDYFRLVAPPTPADMADALAIALCAADNLHVLDARSEAGATSGLAAPRSRRGGGRRASADLLSKIIP